MHIVFRKARRYSEKQDDKKGYQSCFTEHIPEGCVSTDKEATTLLTHRHTHTHTHTHIHCLKGSMVLRYHHVL